MSALTQRLYADWVAKFGQRDRRTSPLWLIGPRPDAQRGPGYPARPAQQANARTAANPGTLPSGDARSRDGSVAAKPVTARPEKPTAARVPTRPASEAQTERSGAVGPQGNGQKNKPGRSANHPGPASI